MIRKYGTSKPPAHVYQAQEIELEKLRAERREQLLAIQQNSERSKRRREAHREWLRSLEIEETVDGLDPENLLRHAYRLLVTLVRENRAPTYEEKTLLDVIAQRHLILDSITDQ